MAVSINEDDITAYRADGRIVIAPLTWSWRLSEATAQQRSHFEVLGNGQGVHWPEIDEDISAEGLSSGVPARRPTVKA